MKHKGMMYPNPDSCSLYEFITGLFVTGSHILYKQLVIDGCSPETKDLLWFFLSKAGYKYIEELRVRDGSDSGFERYVFQNYTQEREIHVRHYKKSHYGNKNKALILECSEILPF